ncbi:unnamed protein product, partial [Ceratitis capitata]
MLRKVQDQYENISSQTNKGIEFLEKYCSFIQDRLAIEKEYATKLRHHCISSCSSLGGGKWETATGGEETIGQAGAWRNVSGARSFFFSRCGYSWHNILLYQVSLYCICKLGQER